MYWLDHTREDDKYLLRGKIFPPAVEVPDFKSTDWNPEGILIGGVPDKLDVNFCYNSMCGNFGLSHSQAETEKRKKPYSIRRKGNQLMLECPECGLTRKIYNNEAVDAMFLHVLKNHLPHQYCNNFEECDHYRHNLYEYYGEYYEPVTDMPEEQEEIDNFKYLVRCLYCGRRFPVGTPWRIHDKRDRQTQSGKTPGRPFPVSTQVFMKLVCNGIGPSAMIELTECNPGDYYAMLHNLAQACNVVSGRYLTELQSLAYSSHVNYAKDDNTMRLYSDIMEISILTDDNDKRIQQLPVLITVTDYRDSFFTLAATPMFMPVSLSSQKMKKLRTQLRHESLYLESHQPHAHLLSDEALRDSDEQPGARKYSYPILGLGGYFVRSGYGALAHFLTLRKMLSCIDRVVHYVDNENTLEMAALTAFADRIQAGQCEVVAVKIDQQKKLKRLKKSQPKFKKVNGHDPEGRDAALKGDSEPEGEKKKDGSTLSDNRSRQAARKKQMNGLVSKLPQSMAAAKARQTAIREAGETVRDARAILRQIIKMYGLLLDIFIEDRQRNYHARNLDDLPGEIFDMAVALTERAKEVAALAKEVAALAGDVDNLTKETSGLADDANRLAEGVTKHSDKKLERPEQTKNPNDLAYAYRLAVNKAVMESGLDLWVWDENAPPFEPNRQFQWLTRRLPPTKGLTEEEIKEQSDKEVDLYLYGKHQPVDTYMSSLRQLASTAERARLIASVRHGAGYVSSPRLPTPIISELALHRFRWNFMRRRREKKVFRNNTRARKLGLSVPGALTVNNASTVRTKVFEWAQKITNHLRGLEDGGARV